MQDLLVGYLLPIGLLIIVWAGLVFYQKRKRRRQKDRRRFGDRR
jgi:hypothetical protein